MNKDIFKAIMKPCLVTNQTRDGNQFAEIMSKAYQAATIGFSGTTYGSKLIAADAGFLEAAIANAINANLSDRTGNVMKSSYKLMAVGFVAYWASAKFLPLPTIPPIATPVNGTVVTFPGSPSPLGDELWLCFSLGYTDQFLDMLSAVLIKFQTTILGVCNGTPAGSTTVADIPWVGIIPV
jgi:hypothetical protein